MEFKTLDYRGVECPEPLIKAIREAMNSPPGTRFEILTDEWECVEKIESAFNDAGLGEARHYKEDGYYRIVAVKK
jgi:TusA-related sulfurtransferase